MRLSRSQPIVRGNLRGLRAKQYYQFQKLTNQNIIANTRKYLPDSIWKKFDRGRGLTVGQATQVRQALNHVMMDRLDDYPFTSVYFKFSYSHPPATRKPRHSLRCLHLEGVHICRIPSMETDKGSGYLISDEKLLEHDGNKGQVVFSSHAIERIVERLDLREMANRNNMAAPKLLHKIIQDLDLRIDADAPMLALKMLGVDIGYLPVVFCSQGVWVCTTFLDHDMKGTPETYIQESVLSDISLGSSIEDFSLDDIKA